MACDGIRLCTRVANGPSWGQVAEYPLIYLFDLRRSGWQVQSVAAARKPAIDVAKRVARALGKKLSPLVAEAERAQRLKGTRFTDSQVAGGP